MERLSQEPLYQCSHWRASAYVGGPNLLTWEDIYQYQDTHLSVQGVSDIVEKYVTQGIKWPPQTA